jgi:H-type lectin domain
MDGCISLHKTSPPLAYADGWYSAGVSLLDLCSCDRDIQGGTWSATLVVNPQFDQAFQDNIMFKRKFPTAPTVIVWLTGFDFEKGRNFRIRAKVTEVTAMDFRIEIGTWSDSLLYWASASWIAYSSDSPRIKSGSYSTMDVRPWNKPQLNDSGKVKFAGQPFEWAPTLLVGVNEFDIDGTKGTSTRWVATTSEVTAAGFTWQLDSWHDTVKYLVGASYLALDNGP